MSDSDIDYDVDVVAWSEHQADALRRRATNEIDWDNVAEEIEDVGSNRRDACRSLLRQALRHMLKAEAWPLSRDVETWRADALDFRQQARDFYRPSMPDDVIDLAGLYRQALRTIPASMEGVPPLPLPATCPVTLAEMLAPEPDESETDEG